MSGLSGEASMEEQQIGWIAAIIIGGIAGWLAEQFMKRNGARDEHRALGPLSLGCSASSVSRLAVGSVI